MTVFKNLRARLKLLHKQQRIVKHLAINKLDSTLKSKRYSILDSNLCPSLTIFHDEVSNNLRV